jgi:hypothetical protein
MKETSLKTETKIEVKTEVTQEKKLQLLGKLILKNNHKVFEFNRVTNTIDFAKYEELPYKVSAVVKTNNLDYYAKHKKQSVGKLIVNQDCIYIPALNKKNVIKILKRDYTINYGNNN